MFAGVNRAVSGAGSAGAGALRSAEQGLPRYAVEISGWLVFLKAHGNVRGVRESDKLYGVPTYCFILYMAVLLGFGIGRMVFGHLPVLQDYP